MARVANQYKWRGSSENGTGPTKMARVTSSEARITSSEINCPVLIFKMAAILSVSSQISSQISSHSVETLRVLKIN
jgi:hypothetical protein